MGKEHDLICLTDLQLEEQFHIIVDFLSAVHPTLLQKEGYKPCIELRPIHRAEEQEFMLNKSLDLWDLEESSLSRLKTFLNRHNGKPTCIYYSVFTFDNNMEAVTTQGKKAKPGKITTAAALNAHEIALDFDNMSRDEYIRIKERFEAMGIFAIWVFSGHGYQCHILLDKPFADKTLLQRVVYKFRAKGFDCDDACIDPARVMRLPGTFNCKCVTDDTLDEVDPPRCEIVSNSATRYPLERIFHELEKLPTVSDHDEVAFLMAAETAERAKKEGAKKNQTKREKPAVKASDAKEQDVVKVTKIQYPHLSKFELPEPISRMLAYTPHGFRNKCLGFMAGFFKQYYRLGFQAAMDILSIWASEACDPAYPESQFRSDFKRFYDAGGLKYDVSLTKQFGYIDFGNLIELRKRDIVIPNAFFKDLANLDGKVVRLYLAIKLLEHIEEPATQASLVKLLGVSDRALRPTLQDLCKSGHGYMKKGVARQQIPNTYHSFKNFSARQGFAVFSYNDIRAYVKELYEEGSRANGELKLYLFMRYKFVEQDIFMSQANLGRHTGVDKSTISRIVYKLQEKHFLKITKMQFDSYYDSCVYTLLR